MEHSAQLDVGTGVGLDRMQQPRVQSFEMKFS